MDCQLTKKAVAEENRESSMMVVGYRLHWHISCRFLNFNTVHDFVFIKRHIGHHVNPPVAVPMYLPGKEWNVN
jgi:hypothetical protein